MQNIVVAGLGQEGVAAVFALRKKFPNDRIIAIDRSGDLPIIQASGGPSEAPHSVLGQEMLLAWFLENSVEYWPRTRLLEIHRETQTIELLNDCETEVLEFDQLYYCLGYGTDFPVMLPNGAINFSFINASLDLQSYSETQNILWIDRTGSLERGLSKEEISFIDLCFEQGLPFSILSTPNRLDLSGLKTPILQTAGEVVDVKSHGERIVGLKLSTGETIATDHIFYSGKSIPRTEILKRVGAQLSAEGKPITNEFGQTNLKNIYALGF